MPRNQKEKEEKYTCFTHLTENPKTIYLATQATVLYKNPLPIKNELSKRDISKFCRFHNDFNHDTNECQNMKSKIEFVIRKNNPHLHCYVQNDQAKAQAA
uniref:Reverse transcriptase domain-containing protein n=1 Tax=Cannabis sativa TaxID=3483 RepID=A0A803PSB2_CANSA